MFDSVGCLRKCICLPVITIKCDKEIYPQIYLIATEKFILLAWQLETFLWLSEVGRRCLLCATIKLLLQEIQE